MSAGDYYYYYNYYTIYVHSVLDGYFVGEDGRGKRGWGEVIVTVFNDVHTCLAGRISEYLSSV